MTELLYGKETYEIRGACFWVWKEFGGSFKESVVQKALLVELKHRGLVAECQKRITLYYRGEKIGVYIPDIIVNGTILIELKCKPFLTKEDEKQFWRYLKGSEYKLGMLINFGAKGLQIKRRIFDKARSA